MIALLLFPAFSALEIFTGSGDRDVVIAITVTVILLLASWFALLRIPIQISRRRPITRRGLWLPILAAAFLLAGLGLGAVLAAAEWHDESTTWLNGFIPLYVAIAGWILWSFIFWLISRSRDPQALGSKLHRYVLTGSALELLIAVPAHIIVRRRTECCAGVATATGLSFGIAIMLVSFGSSVFFLYHRRIKQISNGS